jgi:hypothetical protein
MEAVERALEDERRVAAREAGGKRGYRVWATHNGIQVAEHYAADGTLLGRKAWRSEERPTRAQVWLPEPQAS